MFFVKLPQNRHPERSRGICGAPCSRSKVSVLLVLPQTRHPERSASWIYNVTQGLWRGVEGPRRCLICPCCSELFNHRSPTTGSAAMVTCTSCHVHHLPLLSLCKVLNSSPAVEKLRAAWGKLSTAEVLRLRATSPVSRYKSMRRCAQDDESSKTRELRAKDQ
jgi:hypothetical protein